MTGDQGWLDHGNDDLQQFDYAPQPGSSAAAIASAQTGFAALIEGNTGAADRPGWLRLIDQLPAALRRALVAELRAGNRITAVGSSGWPEPGSVVVNLDQRFTVARGLASDGVLWRRLDDPHFAREEVTQADASPAHLLIS